MLMTVMRSAALRQLEDLAEPEDLAELEEVMEHL